MNPTLNIWCLCVSGVFLLLYLILGYYIFKRYKPNLTCSQYVIILLILLNLTLKMAGFSIIQAQFESNVKNNQTAVITVQIFSIFTSTCFFVGFQILTMHMCLQRVNMQISFERNIQQVQAQNNDSILYHEDQEEVFQECPQEKVLRKQILEIKKKFKIFFFLFGATIIIILILTLLQTIFSSNYVKFNTLVIDYILIGVGAGRLVFLDLPILFIFIGQLKGIQRMKKSLAMNSYVPNFKQMNNKQRILVILSNTLITFSILIYIERIVINDIVSRIQTLIIDQKQMDWYLWIEKLIDVHVVLYLVTDFIGGCIQLYLISWFTKRATEIQYQHHSLDELNDNKEIPNRVLLGKDATKSIVISSQNQAHINYEDMKIPILQNKNYQETLIQSKTLDSMHAKEGNQP